jgi:hypothetical protein
MVIIPKGITGDLFTCPIIGFSFVPDYNFPHVSTALISIYYMWIGKYGRSSPHFTSLQFSLAGPETIHFPSWDEVNER